jgi:hypothetical protein
MLNYGFAVRSDELRQALAKNALVRHSLCQLAISLLQHSLGCFSEEIVNLFTMLQSLSSKRCDISIEN